MSTIGAGTEDYTVKSIIDRLYVQYLTPPDAQPAQTTLAIAMTSAIETISLGEFFIQEDADLVRQGSILEVEQELMQVLAYDTFTRVATVERGIYGTPLTAHSIPNRVILNPPFSRAEIFEAVADNIIQLYPSLSSTDAVLLSPSTDRVYSLGDQLAVEVLTVFPGDFTSTVDIHGEIIDFHPMVGGRALITNVGGGTVWLRYRRRMGRAISEDELLHDLGVDARWANVVIAGTAADLMSGRDLPAARTEWIKSVLEAESIPVGTRMSLAGALRQYRNILLKEAMKEMKAEYKPVVHMRQAGQSVAY
jgi:hypothetical protein